MRNLLGLVAHAKRRAETIKNQLTHSREESNE